MKPQMFYGFKCNKLRAKEQKKKKLFHAKGVREQRGKEYLNGMAWMECLDGMLKWNA